jgi:hypothetical protein
MLLNDLKSLAVPSSSSGFGDSNKPIHKLDDETYTIISEEVESMVIERSLRAHPATRMVWEAALARLTVRREEQERVAAEQRQKQNDDTPIANGNGAAYETKDFSPGTTPSVNGGTFRFLSPDSDDGHEHRPRSRAKRERSPSP